MNIQNTEKAKMKLANVVEKEMGLWRSLFTGAAVLEHLEHKYHEVLKVRLFSPTWNLEVVTLPCWADTCSLSL